MTSVPIRENNVDTTSFLSPQQKEEVEEEQEEYKEKEINQHQQQNNNNNNRNEEEAKENDEEPSACSSFRQKLFQYKFEISIVVVSFTVLSAAAWYLKHIVYETFDKQPECAACFKNNPSGFVFNQTDGACFFYNATATLSYFFDDGDDENQKETIVFNSDYCGAPHCQKETLMRGVTPIPYWMIGLSTTFSIVICILINMMKIFMLRPLKRVLYRWLDRENFPDNTDELFMILNEAIRRNPTSEKLKRLQSLYQALNIFGRIDEHYYLLLYLFNLAQFIFIIVHVCTSPIYADDFFAKDNWKKFEAVYALFLNSGSLNVFLFMYTQAPLSSFLSVTKVKEHLDTIGSLGHRFEKAEAKFSLSLTSPLTALTFIKTGSLSSSASSPNSASPNGLRKFGRPKADTGAGSFIFSSPSTVGMTFLTLLAPPLAPIIFTHVLPACLIFLPLWLLML